MRKPEQEQRLHHRFKIAVSVELQADGFAPVTLKTRDMSDSGVFLVHDDPAALPALGSLIRMRVMDPLQGGAAPEVRGTIIRVDKDGIAIHFES